MNYDREFLEELDNCAGDAALYVLGALAPENAKAFEQRLRSGCRFCSTQAERYGLVAEHLSASAPAVAPAPELRQRLLERIKPNPPKAMHQPAEGAKIVRQSDAPWTNMHIPGVKIRSLIGDKTFMVRLRPGATFPPHDHSHAEQCYVLDGSITDSAGTTLHAGDFIVMSSGTRHDTLRSDTGCTLFIVYAD